MSHGNTYIHINQINKQSVKIILEHVYSSEILKILTVSQFANVKDMYFYGSGVSIDKKLTNISGLQPRKATMTQKTCSMMIYTETPNDENLSTEERTASVCSLLLGAGKR